MSDGMQMYEVAEIYTEDHSPAWDRSKRRKAESPCDAAEMVAADLDWIEGTEENPTTRRFAVRHPGGEEIGRFAVLAEIKVTYESIKLTTPYGKP